MLNRKHQIFTSGWAAAGVVLILSAATVAIAADGGGYDLTSRNTVGIAALWAILLAVGLGLWPVQPIPRSALVAGGFLLLFAVWTGLSALWADSSEHAFDEFDRAIIYLALYALAVMVSGRFYRQWLAGIAVGIVGVAGIALASRFFPHLIERTEQLAQLFPAAERRLSVPVDYWNGLAALMAFGLPLLLLFAVSARSTILRGLALAPVPGLVSVIYLTSSRGGSVAAALAVVVFLALTSRRWTAVGALTVGGLGSALAVAMLVQRSELVDHPLESAAASGQGRSAAILLPLICLATGLVFMAATRVVPYPRPLPPTVAAGGAVALIALVAVGIVAAHPVQRFEDFKQQPGNLNESIQTHLFSGSSNGRWQLWSAAADAFKDRPLTGQGAGSYEAWWAQHGELSFFVRDAHSLYVETLGELGVVGLVLLLGFLVTPVVVGVKRLRAVELDDQAVLAALLAVTGAYLFQAGVDWMWELTVVSAVAVTCMGVMTSALGSARPATAPRPLPVAARISVPIVLLVLLIAQAIPLLRQMRIDESQDAIRNGDASAAVDDALAAKSLQPWASSPYLQLALVRERAGQIELAHQAILDAIERDDSDWRLWLIAARLETKLGQVDQAQQSLGRARVLNPRSPLFANP